jgi:hypothetical protein
MIGISYSDPLYIHAKKHHIIGPTADAFFSPVVGQHTTKHPEGTYFFQPLAKKKTAFGPHFT